jgi:hypothetical protein
MFTYTFSSFRADFYLCSYCTVSLKNSTHSIHGSNLRIMTSSCGFMRPPPPKDRWSKVEQFDLRPVQRSRWKAGSLILFFRNSSTFTTFDLRSGIRSMSSIQPICKCRCPPVKISLFILCALLSYYYFFIDFKTFCNNTVLI